MINALINLLARDVTTRDGIVKGCEEICKVMSKWGLTARASKNGKNPKTEAVLFPSASTLKRWRSQNLNAIRCRTVQASEFSRSSIITKTKYVDLKHARENAHETKIAIIENGACTRFSTKFTHIESAIDLLLGGSEGAKSRISKAPKSMATLKFIWDNSSTPVETKIKLFSVIS